MAVNFRRFYTANMRKKIANLQMLLQKKESHPGALAQKERLQWNGKYDMFLCK